MTIPKFRKLSGIFTPPGDKSISHREAMLASLAHGRSFIKNFLHSGDTDATLAALSHLGVEVIHKNNGIEIIGRGLKGLKKSEMALDLKNSGTSLKLFTGLLSAQRFSSTLTGDSSLCRRPMGELIRHLRAMGAMFSAPNARVLSPVGYPPPSSCVRAAAAPLPAPPARLTTEMGAPIVIDPCLGRLKGISCALASPSAQLKSALLLASLYSEGITEIRERIPTRDHTERLLNTLGIPVDKTEGLIKMRGGEGEIKFFGMSFNIPGDISSASFFIAAALLIPNSELEIRSVGLNPTRTGFLDIARAMGGRIEVEIVHQSDEPFGNIYVKSSELKGISIAESLTIRAIDEIPLVALLATQAEGETEICGTEPLHFKESDRISAIVTELNRMGAKISHDEDRLLIEGPTPLRGETVQSHDDHRIAMMLSIAAQIAEGEVEIDDLSSISVSFPGYFNALTVLTTRKPMQLLRLSTPLFR